MDDADVAAASAAAGASAGEDAGGDKGGTRAKLRPRRQEDPERTGNQERARKKLNVEIPEQKQQEQGG